MAVFYFFKCCTVLKRHFPGSYLASKEDLTPFLSPDAPGGAAGTLRRLRHLHLVADLAVLLQTYLAPGSALMADVVKRALRQFDDGDDFNGESAKTFRIPIQSPEIRDQLTK